MLTPKITSVLQAGTKASIKTLTRIHGRDCEIYDPKGTGIYSGQYSDIDYDEEPTEIRKLLIPNLFSKLTTAAALAQYDTFGQSEYYIILPHDEVIPNFTKIVAKSPTLGVVRLVVRDNQIVSTFDGRAFNRIELRPLFDSSQDSDLITELRLDINDTEPAGVDNSIDTKPGSSKYGFYLDTGDIDYND